MKKILYHYNEEQGVSKNELVKTYKIPLINIYLLKVIKEIKIK